MGDVIKEIPPRSRFFEEDLNNFASPSPHLPSPLLLFSQPYQQPLRPSLLIIALSSPSLYRFHNVLSKTLIGSLILPEIPFSSTSFEPSLTDNTCNIYFGGNGDLSDTILVSVQCSVPAERSHLVAKLLIVNAFVPEKVLIFDSILAPNYRGWLSSDEVIASKLETSAARKRANGEKLLKGLDYYPDYEY